MRTCLRDKLPKQTFIDLYLRQNMSLEEIAGMVGFSVAAVTRLKKEYGIATKPAAAYADRRKKGLMVKLERSKGRMQMRGNVRKLLSRDLLKRLYCEDRKSLEDIGRVFGCSRAYVMKLCRQYAIPRRSKAAARVEAMRQGKFPDKPYYEIDEAFFARWSAASAYVFGLLVTDSTMSGVGGGTYSVTLALNDRALLEKVRSLMSSSHPIRQSKWQPKLHIFHFARQRMMRDLLMLGLSPKKSLTVKFPAVPRQVRRHFIRGCWDGDGCVFLAGRDRRYLRTSFTSGSKDFIYALELILRVDASLTERTIYHRGKSYYFKYCQKDSEKLFHYLYDDVPPSMYLERKYQKFIQGISGRSSRGTQMNLLEHPQA